MKESLTFFGRLPPRNLPKRERAAAALAFRKGVLAEFYKMLAYVVQTEGPDKVKLAWDYDGTLAPFDNDPLRAYPYPGVVDLLNDLSEQGVQQVIVTGREVRAIRQLLLLKHPLEVWGVHGWERETSDGKFSRTPLTPNTIRALRRVRAWMDFAEEQGAWYEEKGGSIVLHWRSLMEAGNHEAIAAIVKAFDARWKVFSGRKFVSRHPINGGLEVRAKSSVKGKVNKGTVVSSLMKDVALGMFAGDDTTDEEAFMAVRYNAALRDKVMTILVTPEWRQSSEAAAHLKPPEELIEFLRRCNEICRKPACTVVSLPLMQKTGT